jgi:hypothetical protein
MANIYVNTCSDTAPGQNWTVMDDGRIVVAASTGTSKSGTATDCFSNTHGADHDIEQCLDLQYLCATQNNPVGLYDCAGLGNTGARDKGINWPLEDVAATSASEGESRC